MSFFPIVNNTGPWLTAYSVKYTNEKTTHLLYLQKFALHLYVYLNI